MLGTLNTSNTSTIVVRSSSLTHLQRSEGLLNTSSNAKVVDGGMLDDALLINDEQSSQGNSLHIKNQNRVYKNLNRDLKPEGNVLYELSIS